MSGSAIISWPPSLPVSPELILANARVFIGLPISINQPWVGILNVRQSYLHHMTTVQKTMATIVVTVVLLAVSVLVTLMSAGVGHGGSYLPFALLFPFSFLVAAAVPNTLPLIWAVALAQFPAYGLVVGRRWISHPLRKAAFSIGVTHAVAAVMSTVIYFSQ